ncbi:DUF3962 domain-containing protein [Kitasatospora sp. NPDC007106]|uniref:pPIWI_RE module domain-containing protein n=1 Tax=Kitasatospora sp. NPDC007106 TaxID=3156914 RepID=UPI0033CA1B7D
MAVKYRTIRTAAWTPISAEASLTARYRALSFPEQWRDALLALCNAGRPASSKPLRTVPTFRMDQALQALTPDLIVRPRSTRNSDDTSEFWLYKPEELPDPLPGPAFRGLLSTWLRDLRPEPEHRAQLREVQALLTDDPPQWQPVEAEMLQCPKASGGTAAPEPRQFQLTTDYLARRILALEPYDFGAGKLRFRAVPRGPRDQGAELVSQPLPWEAKGRTWWYSVVLNITLHTVPFHPLPRVHLNTHIRRWATRTSSTTGWLRLPYGRRTSVLLRPRTPWLPGAPASDRFAVARLEWSRATKGIDWVGGGPAGMLRSLSLAEPFPDAGSILAAPEEWLTDSMRAAVVHSTAMGAHEVGAGLMSDQRSKITEWAEEALPEVLRPVPPLEFTTRAARHTPANSRPKPKDALSKAAEEVRAAAARRAGAAFALRHLGGEGADSETPPVLEARLLWQTSRMRDTAIATLVTHLDLKGDGGAPSADAYEAARPGEPVVLEWESPEVTVRLRCLKLTDSLASDLPLPADARPTRDTLTAALAARRVQVAAFLTADRTDPLPTLALVEIDRRKDFTTPDHDPKFAIRLGCADAGVLTQFMAVPKHVAGYNSEKNADFRALKAWDDGLRQLGVRVHPEHSLGEQLPDGLRYAAVWMVRKNARSRTRWAGYEPVAIRVTPEQPGTGLARVEGWDRKADDGAGAWIPYPAFLLRLTQLCEIPSAAPGQRSADEAEAAEPAGRPSWWQDMNEQRRRTEEWLQKVIRSLRGTPTLLLAHAQNCRSHWTWLQDGRVEPDRIRTGHAQPRSLDSDLRLVRVRTGQGRETPQWWGVHPDDGVNGLPAHLWTNPTAEPGTARVFWSTTPKAFQFAASAVEADKLAPRPLRSGKRKGELTIDTDKPAWNPGLVELSVLGCHPADGDDAEALALAVHQLRQAPDFPDALSLPLPLHLAGLAQEYVLPTVSEDNQEPLVDPAADADPDTAEAVGLAGEPEPEPGQLSLFPDTVFSR